MTKEEQLKRMQLANKNRLTATQKKELVDKQLESIPDGYKSHYRLIPDRYKLLFLKSFHNTRSLSLAIKAKCLDCDCFQIDQIADCDIRHCPLWNFRPFRHKNKKSGDDKK